MKCPWCESRYKQYREFELHVEREHPDKRESWEEIKREYFRRREASNEFVVVKIPRNLEPSPSENLVREHLYRCPHCEESFTEAEIFQHFDELEKTLERI